MKNKIKFFFLFIQLFHSVLHCSKNKEINKMVSSFCLYKMKFYQVESAILKNSKKDMFL